MNAQPLVSLSIVSHSQSSFIKDLLDDINGHCNNVEVLLTINIPETLSFNCDKYNFPIRVMQNDNPRGFGANHNAAFKYAKGSFFCILNPDIKLTSDPLPTLIECCGNERTGVVAPLVANPAGVVEKTARRFPNPLRILSKLCGLGEALEYKIGEECFSPDWVAGMFMLFPAAAYKKIGGFDENYFLYYEDVDICARLWLAGYKVLLCPSVSIIHDARHESHRNLRYLKWHLASMIRFFSQMFYWRLTGRKLVVE